MSERVRDGEMFTECFELKHSSVCGTAGQLDPSRKKPHIHINRNTRTHETAYTAVNTAIHTQSARAHMHYCTLSCRQRKVLEYRVGRSLQEVAEEDDSLLKLHVVFHPGNEHRQSNQPP